MVDSRDLTCVGEGGCDACDDMVALAYALEQHSSHPLAQAIEAEAERRQVRGRYPAAEGLRTPQRAGTGRHGQRAADDDR